MKCLGAGMTRYVGLVAMVVGLAACASTEADDPGDTSSSAFFDRAQGLDCHGWDHCVRGTSCRPERAGSSPTSKCLPAGGENAGCWHDSDCVQGSTCFSAGGNTAGFCARPQVCAQMVQTTVQTCEPGFCTTQTIVNGQVVTTTGQQLCCPTTRPGPLQEQRFNWPAAQACPR